MRSGVASLTWNSDIFEYAEGRDEKADRSGGLIGGQHCTAILDSNSLLVKPDLASKQVAQEQADAGERLDSSQSRAKESKTGRRRRPHQPRRCSSLPRFCRDRSCPSHKEIADIVVNVVELLVGEGEVNLRLEVEADLPDGASDTVVRTVNENAKVLRCDTFGFEEE